MLVSQKVIAPFGVIGFPTWFGDTNLVKDIKHELSVLIHRAINDGYGDKVIKHDAFISIHDFIEMLVYVAKINGATEGFATVYILFKKHKSVGTAFKARFQVPGDPSWHDVLIENWWAP